MAYDPPQGASAMKLQHSRITETPDGRMVEMLFADQPDPGEDEAQIRGRVFPNEDWRQS